MSMQLPPPLPQPGEPASTPAGPDDLGRGQSATIAGWTWLLPIGMVLVIISILVEWGTDRLFDKSRTAAHIPLQLLWDTTPASLDSAPLLWLLAPSLLLMFVTIIRPGRGFAGVAGGAVALGVALLYVNAIRSVLADDLFVGDQSLTDGIGVGTWLCVVGGLCALVGSIINLRRRSTR